MAARWRWTAQHRLQWAMEVVQEQRVMDDADASLLVYFFCSFFLHAYMNLVGPSATFVTLQLYCLRSRIGRRDVGWPYVMTSITPPDA